MTKVSLQLALVALLGLAGALAPFPWQTQALAKGTKKSKQQILRASNASKYLKVGDILLNYEEHATTAVQGVIRAGQTLIKLTYSPFRKYLKKGKEGASHAALYIGGGLVAEAEGTHPDNALVRIQTIDVHAGSRFLVYRNKNQKLATHAMWVARYWANGSIPYSVPGHVFFNGPKYNEQARRTALLYAQHAFRRGGPPGRPGMFCSQFVVAAYQAAFGAPQVKANAKLTYKELRMPASLMINANNASPMDMTAHFKHTKTKPHAFQLVNDIRVNIKALVKRVGAGDWILDKSGQLVHIARHGINKSAKAVGKELSKGAKAVGKGAAYVGKKVSKGVQHVGKEMGKGAKAVGKEVSKGATKVGKELSKGAKTVGKGATHVGKHVVKGFKNMGKGIANLFKGKKKKEKKKKKEEKTKKTKKATKKEK